MGTWYDSIKRWNTKFRMLRIDDEDLSGMIRDFSSRVVDFWQPDGQLERYAGTPRMSREKHFYEFSNQFILGNGQVADAKP